METEAALAKGLGGVSRHVPAVSAPCNKIMPKKLEGAIRVGYILPSCVLKTFLMNWRNHHASSCHHRRARVGQSPGKIRSQPTTAGCKPSEWHPVERRPGCCAAEGI